MFITNAPFWCIHLLKSENIICRGIRYDAKLVNNDGISLLFSPEYTRNLLIENIEFNNGDDNVAIKCGRDNDGWKTSCPSENIIIRNCKFKGLHGVVLYPLDEPGRQIKQNRPDQKWKQHTWNAFLIKGRSLLPDRQQKKSGHHHKKRHTGTQHGAINRTPEIELRIGTRFRRSVKRISAMDYSPLYQDGDKTKNIQM